MERGGSLHRKKIGNRSLPADKRSAVLCRSSEVLQKSLTAEKSMQTDCPRRPKRGHYCRQFERGSQQVAQVCAASRQIINDPILSQLNGAVPPIDLRRAPMTDIVR